jgi:hypothetical protein
MECDCLHKTLLCDDTLVLNDYDYTRYTLRSLCKGLSCHLHSCMHALVLLNCRQSHRLLIVLQPTRLLVMYNGGSSYGGEARGNCKVCDQISL